MTPKLLPSATDILRRVRETIREMIVPSLSQQSERSAAATIDHLLRYVEQLIDHQGQTLLDEEVRLKAVLLRSSTWLQQQQGNAVLAEKIRVTIARARDQAVFTTVAMMQDDVALLRQLACDTLLVLHAAGHAKDPEGALLHEELRGYIRWQLLEEEKLVKPAFLGHGPRR